jgi:hypothetical protein
MNVAAGKLGISPRSVATFFGLLALAIQSLVIQTHVHVSAAYTHQISSVHAPVNATHDQYPANEDPTNCPLCQEMVIGGSFLVPVAIPLPVPIVIDSEVASYKGMISVSVASHSWHGRAPPSA